MTRNYQWLLETVGSLYKLRESSRNCKQPLGDEMVSSQQEARALIYSCKEIYSANNLNELGSEFFSSQASR